MKEFSDEIIVVDTGSEDRTVEIAEAEGAVVYHFEWCNDFSAAKNYALDQATGDWIVFLDADEYFDEPTRKKIRSALKHVHGNRKVIGFDSLLYNIDIDCNNTLKSTARQKRIFRNMKQLRYQKRIHEHLVYYGKKAVHFLFSKDLSIYHTGYSKSLTQNKNLRNLNLLLADIQTNGNENPTHYSYLSVCYFNLKQYDNAIHYAKLAVHARDKGIKSALIKQYWIWMKSEQVQQAPDGILQEIVDAALVDIPNHPDFLWEDAKLALMHRNFILSEQRIQQILKQIKDEKLMCEYESTIFGQLSIIYAAFGKILETKGHIEEAINYYKTSLQENPYKENVLRDLLKLLDEQKPQDTIIWMDYIYNPDRDNAFLAKCLKNRPLDEIYSHFIRPNKDSYDNLMCKRSYHEAAKEAAKRLSYILGSSECFGVDAIVDDAASVGSDLILALLSLPTEKFMECNAQVALLPDGIKKILQRFHGSKQPLSADDTVAYYAILDDVLQHSLPEIIDRFGILARELGEEDLLKTAVKLYEKGRWQTVLTLYEYVSNECKTSLPGFWYYAGICLFYLGKRSAAYDHLIHAQKMGMKSQDLPSYLAWCKESRE